MVERHPAILGPLVARFNCARRRRACRRMPVFVFCAPLLVKPLFARSARSLSFLPSYILAGAVKERCWSRFGCQKGEGSRSINHCIAAMTALPQQQRPWGAFERHTMLARIQCVRPAALLRLQHTRSSSSRIASADSAADARRAHNQAQADKFSAPDIVDEFCQPLPPEIDERLARIVGAVPGLGPESRVVDVGAGAGALVPHLRRRGVRDILAVDVTPAMLARLAQRFPPPPGTLGNDLGVRTWLGDVADLPGYLGPADAFFFNAVFGNLHDPRAALLRAALLLRPGGYVMLSHPLGRAWHAGLRAAEPSVVPHALPGRGELAASLAGLPLRLLDCVDEPELWCALLQVPPAYELGRPPIYLTAPVVRGFGRGSRQLGVPTANLDPVEVGAALAGLTDGVYFGWAKLTPPWSSTAGDDDDGGVHKMVMNVGRRPTVNAGDEAPSVELHILHAFKGDSSTSGEDIEFYGAHMRAAVVGFLRPEIRFSGLPELLARIRADVGAARVALDDARHAGVKCDLFFD